MMFVNMANNVCKHILKLLVATVDELLAKKSLPGVSPEGCSVRWGLIIASETVTSVRDIRGNKKNYFINDGKLCICLILMVDKYLFLFDPNVL